MGAGWASDRSRLDFYLREADAELLALSEQEPNVRPVIELARALREQIDWELVRSRSNDSPFARAFFMLVEGLGIVESESSFAA